MNVLEHITRTRIIFPLSLLGVDLYVTTLTLTLFTSIILVYLFYFLSTRNLKPVPGRLQNIAELVVVFIRDEVAGQIQHERERWVPFLIALFSFILVNNLLGLIPGVSASTANINVTATLAVIVFLTVQANGIRKLGPVRFFKNFLPEGVPLIVAFFMVPVEIVSQLAKPFSLAIRLFANIFAGHAIMFLIIALILMFKSYLIAPLPIIGEVAIMLFELFVAGIQAFIFTYLSALYIEAAQEGL